MGTLSFLIFHTFVCNFFPAPPLLPCQIYRQMYVKLEKLIERVLAKLHPSNLANKIFHLVFYIAIHKLVKFDFGSYLPSDSHINTVISDRFAYPQVGAEAYFPFINRMSLP